MIKIINRETAPTPRSYRRIEVASILTCLALFILMLGKILFTQERIFAHDTIWFYGVFHHLADAIANGFFPYWDPYDYSGQPFYSNLSIMHLSSPITMAFIFFNRITGTSILSAYHWHFIIEIIIANIGVYLAFRQLNRYRFSNVVTLIVFLFSSFSYISLRQAGFLYAFIWFGWAFSFFLRLIKAVTVFNIIGFSLFLGLAMSGYQGLFVLVYLAAFFVTLFINNRAALIGLLGRKNWFLLAILFLIVGSLAAPLLSVYIDRNDFIPMARLRTSPLETGSYTDKSGAVPAEINDFCGLINKRRAVRGYFEEKGVALSEAFLYIGIVPLIMALIGIILTQDRFKLNFLCMLLFVFLMMLGDTAHMQRLVNRIFPPFQFVRHMQLFAGFFIFNLVYFVGKGSDWCIEHISSIKLRRPAAVVAILFILFDLITYGTEALGYVTLPRGPMRFNEHASPITFLPRRFERVVSYDDIRYFKPLLYKRPTVFNACTIAPYFSHSQMRNDLYELMTQVGKADGFIFSNEALKKDVAGFIRYGAMNFSSWQQRDKEAFIDILHVVLTDMARHINFYSRFEGFQNVYTAANALVAIGRQDIIQGKPHWPSLEKAKEFILMLLDLRLAVKKDSDKFTYLFMGKEYDFNSRASLHIHLFKKMPLQGYLEYVWGTSHVEEFTLLLAKDYKELIDLPQAYQDRRYSIIENINTIAGVSADIIRFYPDAVFLARQDIKQKIASDSFERVLYIEADGAAVPHPSDPGQEQSFSYKIMRYMPHHLKLYYEASQDGFLYYADGYDKYWKAYIDGKMSPVYKANLSFKAIAIPKGSHRVTFLYKPVWFQVSLTISYAVMLICLIYLLLCITPQLRKKF